MEKENNYTNLKEFKYSITYYKTKIDVNLRCFDNINAKIERVVDDIKENYINKDNNEVSTYYYQGDPLSLRNDISKFIYTLVNYSQYNVKQNKIALAHKGGWFNKLKKTFVNQANFNILINDKVININNNYTPYEFDDKYFSQELFDYLATIVEYDGNKISLNFNFRIQNN